MPNTPSLKVDRSRVSDSTDRTLPASGDSKSGSESQSRQIRLQERLRQLHINTPEIAASIIVSNDGLTMASALPSSVKEPRVSAMAAVMLSMSERIAGELGRGLLDQVYIKGKIGHFVLMSIGGKAVLTAIARENVKSGLLILDLQRAALDLVKMI